jgi:hypothetical protein
VAEHGLEGGGEERVRLGARARPALRHLIRVRARVRVSVRVRVRARFRVGVGFRVRVKVGVRVQVRPATRHLPADRDCRRISEQGVDIGRAAGLPVPRDLREHVGREDGLQSRLGLGPGRHGTQVQVL